MSFIMPSQRAFQQPELNSQSQSNRIHMPPASFDSYPVQSLPNSSIQQPPPQSQLQNGPTQPSFVPDHPTTSLPKVGETRCYWTLLSSDLHFIYLDPVLASHLGEQADSLVGKSLLDFVHPDEQASAKVDLGGVLDSRTLHGSITRVRYSRLSRVRRQLGYQGPPPGWNDADKIAVDANYMAVDIVINWAAEGLVLCFIHAVVDLTPNDNDEQNKTGWTNWCGTPQMGMDQIHLLYRRLLVCIPQARNTRVFQILSNQPGRPLLMNWPPDHGPGPTGRDFAKLVEDVRIGTGLPSGNDAKTSCTRRYRATQHISASISEVESIFIPHGTVIFACHKVNSTSRSATSANTTIQHMGYNPNSYVPQQNQQQYYEQGSPYVLPPLPSSSSSSSSYNYIPQQSQPIPAQYSPPHWSQAGDPPNSQPQYATWNTPSPAHSISPLPSANSLRSGSYPPPSQGQQWSTQSSSSYMEDDSPMTQGSPGYGYGAGEPETGSPSSPNDVVPPPKRRVSPGTMRDQYGPGGRSAGNRPMGVLKCSSCKATQSPEWRKGPSGKKELCNACGLRYARSRAKKEGHNLTQRRRKDKGLTVVKRESATPPVSSGTAYSSRRSDYEDPPFMSPSSAGSGSGSEVYSHSGHPTLDNLTPSPSPPAASMSFVHYSPHPHHAPNPQIDSRSHYSSPSSFYSVPSPLSNPPVIHHGNQPSVPRLEQVTTYSDRPSPTSPVAQSPLTTTMAPASFERERDKDRELPPTPVSAEPRHVGRRSILLHQ